MIADKIARVWSTRRYEALTVFAILTMCALRAFAGGHASWMPLNDALKLVVDSNSDIAYTTDPKISAAYRTVPTNVRRTSGAENVST